MTDFNLTALRAARKNMLGMLHAHTIQELNFIPENFNNNLLWNAGHVVVTQQLLCYGLANLPMSLPKEMIAEFRKGSKPTRHYNEAEKQQISDLLVSTVDDFAQDLQTKNFGDFKVYPTSFGVTLHNVTEAAAFNLAHEAMHLGTMIALRKLV